MTSKPVHGSFVTESQETNRILFDGQCCRPSSTRFQSITISRISEGENNQSVRIRIKKEDKFYYWYRVKKEAKIIELQVNKKESLKYISSEFSKIDHPNNKIIFDVANFYKNSREYRKAIEYYSMVIDSLDDKDIKRALTERYSDFILYDPKFNKNTYFLWLAPFIVLLIGFWGVYSMSAKNYISHSKDRDLEK